MGGRRGESQYSHQGRADRVAWNRPRQAQAILDYRKANGAFKSVEELKDVKGIGAKRFEKLKPELTVAPAAVRAASAATKPAAAAKGEIRAAEAHVRK